MNKYHLKNHAEREITNKQVIDEIIENGKYVTIAMCHNNEPYVVTLSYGYDKTIEALFFHCAPGGLKIDFLKANKHVCATIIEDKGYIKDECAHAYRSVVFWGEMKVVAQIDEMKYAMQVLLNHQEDNPGIKKQKLLNSDKMYDSKMAMLKLKIKQVHAKEGR